MKTLKEVLILIAMLIFVAVVFFGMAKLISNQEAEATYDRRPTNANNQVARLQFAQQSWATGEGHAAANDTIQYVNGTIYRIDVIISSVTDNPTVTLTLRDHNGIILVPDALFSTIADGTNHYFLAESNLGTPDADFNPVPHSGNVIATFDPSADPGGAAQTLTVDLILYIR